MLGCSGTVAVKTMRLVAHELDCRLRDRRDVFLLQGLRVDLRQDDVHRLVEEAVVADLLLDQGPWRLAGPEAADAHARRQLLVRLLHRLGLPLVVDFDLQLYLSLGKGFGCYFHFFSFGERRSAVCSKFVRGYG